MDVLRDRDGRIYVVDANNTPAGPPNGMTAEQRLHAARILTAALRDMLDDWVAQAGRAEVHA